MLNQLANEAFHIERLANQMTHSQTGEVFLCSDCKHHLSVREDMGKVICAVTLEFKSRDQVASCEYASQTKTCTKDLSRS